MGVHMTYARPPQMNDSGYDFETFLLLADSGSFASTARQLGVSRSTVMRRIDALEKRLGVTLVQRANRQVVLTPTGTAYAEMLRPAVNAFNQANAKVLQLGDAPRGSLRLWLPLMGIGAILAPLFAAFRRRYPEVTLDIELGRDVRRLEPGMFDVALQLGLEDNPGLAARVIADESMFLVASPAYLSLHSAPQHMSQIRDHDCILVRDPEGATRPWRYGPELQPIDLPAPVLIVNSMSTAVHAALEGVGIASVSSLLAYPHVVSGALVPVLDHMTWASKKLCLVYLPNPEPKVRAFVDFTATWVQQQFFAPPEASDNCCPSTGLHGVPTRH
ncbi:MAG: LysR family transcriptional regulator [Myxococcota bacterium]